MSDLTHQFNKFPSFEGKQRSEPAAVGALHPIRRTKKMQRKQNEN
jgi:hypothetical protein